MTHRFYQCLRHCSVKTYSHAHHFWWLLHSPVLARIAFLCFHLCPTSLFIYAVITLCFLSLLCSSPSPSSSPMSVEPGAAQSLSHSLTSSRTVAAAAVARGGRGLWLWLAMVVVLAGTLTLAVTGLKLWNVLSPVSFCLDAVLNTGRWYIQFSSPAGLLALLASLVMQPAVDAAPVGTGDSWMTIQQLLWPYAGLQHNGQPPI